MIGHSGSLGGRNAAMWVQTAAVFDECATANALTMPTAQPSFAACQSAAPCGLSVPIMTTG